MDRLIDTQLKNIEKAYDSISMGGKLEFSKSAVEGIYQVLKELRNYIDTGLTLEEIQNLHNKYCTLLEMYDKLQKDRDSWEREAIADKAKLGEYKILEGQGLLIKLPCKVGDTVWQLMIDVEKCKHRHIGYTIHEAKVIRYEQDSFYTMFSTLTTDGKYKNTLVLKAFGETVFLTREEAEQALKGMEDKIL